MKAPTDMAEEPAIDCGGDMGTLLRQLRQRARDLKNPNWGDARRFPVYRPGMSTAQYIAHYQQMNVHRHLLLVTFTRGAVR